MASGGRDSPQIHYFCLSLEGTFPSCQPGKSLLTSAGQTSKPSTAAAAEWGASGPAPLARPGPSASLPPRAPRNLAPQTPRTSEPQTPPGPLNPEPPARLQGHLACGHPALAWGGKGVECFCSLVLFVA